MGSGKVALVAAAALLAALAAAAVPAAAADAVVAAQAPDPRSVPHIVYGAECTAYMVICSGALLRGGHSSVACALPPCDRASPFPALQDWQVVSLVYSARKAGFKGPITR